MKMIKPGFKFLLSVLFMFFAQLVSAFAQRSDTVDILYASTSSTRGSKGMYVLQLDRKTGSITEIQTVEAGVSSSFLDISPDRKYLYTINGNNGGLVMSFKINSENGGLTKINEQPSVGGPAHVSVDPKGRFVYISNYGGGSLNVFPINKDGSLAPASDMVKYEGSGPNLIRQLVSHTHSSIPSIDGKFLYVSDLGTDKIMIYEVKKNGKLKPAATPFFKSTPGAGPRHFTFHPSGEIAFSVNELTSNLTSFLVNKSTGALTRVDELSMLPADFKEASTAADVHVSPDGKFVYASNRGHDSLVIFEVDPATGKLKFVGHESTGGKFPRNFMMDSKGEFLLAANQSSDNIVIFKRNKSTGKLTRIGEYNVPAPLCIQQL